MVKHLKIPATFIKRTLHEDLRKNLSNAKQEAFFKQTTREKRLTKLKKFNILYCASDSFHLVRQKEFQGINYIAKIYAASSQDISEVDKFIPSAKGLLES